MVHIAGTNVSYKITLLACYVGYFVQAVNVNLVAVIFIPLREQFGLTYAQFGTLISVNFIVQLIISISASKPLDRFGTRPFVVPSLCSCVVGLFLFAFTPALFPGHIYPGFMASMLFIAIGGGLLELCLSPIVDAIPSGAADSSKALSFLHSFYAWGQAAVVLLTTGLLYAGVRWSVIVMLWAVIPAVDMLLFSRAPIAERATGDKALPIRKLLGMRAFVIALIAIAFGGAVETIIAQYASSFLERGVGLPKITGDILGLCGFAMFLGIGRLLYGVFGEKININAILIGGSALAFSAYLVIALAPADAPTALSVAPPVIAIALCGLFVSLLWPGTLAIASKNLPFAGASLFALLAASGSLGCSIGPWVSGVVTDFSMRFNPGDFAFAFGGTLNPEQFGLRVGLLIAAIFPLASLISQIVLKKITKAGGQPFQ